MNEATAAARTQRVIDQLEVGREVIDLKLCLMRRQLQGMLESERLQGEQVADFEEALSQYVMSATRVISKLREIEGFLATGTQLSLLPAADQSRRADTEILR